ncbi:hypothetical protein MXD58_029160, partial [Frankia sp. AgKG'84/4]|nr:hypothetical protein [Frankia sp. AgKG'84/4]
MASGADTNVDMLIIGAGPVGLFGAYYAGFRGMSVALMDTLPEAGGQITAMYPEKVIYDVAGFPAVRGRELVAALVAQAGRYDPVYLLDRQATELTREPDGVVVASADGHRVHARVVVITGGLGSFAPKPLAAAAGHLGRGLAYFVPRPQEHAGRDVIVAGGADGADDFVEGRVPVFPGGRGAVADGVDQLAERPPGVDRGAQHDDVGEVADGGQPGPRTVAELGADGDVGLPGAAVQQHDPGGQRDVSQRGGVRRGEVPQPAGHLGGQGHPVAQGGSVDAGRRGGRRRCGG